MIKINFYKKIVYSIPKKRLVHLAYKAEKLLIREKIFKAPQGFVIECTFVDNRRIQVINRKFHGKNRSTDVVSLSFVARPPRRTRRARPRPSTSSGLRSVARHRRTPSLAGEIFISVPFAKTQAKKLGHKLSYEVQFLFVHGLLHIFGYDHETPKERRKMFRLTDAVLDHGRL